MRGLILLIVILSPLIFWSVMVLWEEARTPRPKALPKEGEFIRLAGASRYKHAWRELDDWESRFREQANHHVRR